MDTTAAAAAAGTAAAAAAASISIRPCLYTKPSDCVGVHRPCLILMNRQPTILHLRTPITFEEETVRRPWGGVLDGHYYLFPLLCDIPNFVHTLYGMAAKCRSIGMIQRRSVRPVAP